MIIEAGRLKDERLVESGWVFWGGCVRYWFCGATPVAPSWIEETRKTDRKRTWKGRREMNENMDEAKTDSTWPTRKTIWRSCASVRTSAVVKFHGQTEEASNYFLLKLVVYLFIYLFLNISNSVPFSRFNICWEFTAHRVSVPSAWTAGRNLNKNKIRFVYSLDILRSRRS